MKRRKTILLFWIRLIKIAQINLNNNLNYTEFLASWCLIILIFISKVNSFNSYRINAKVPLSTTFLSLFSPLLVFLKISRLCCVLCDGFVLLQKHQQTNVVHSTTAINQSPRCINNLINKEEKSNNHYRINAIVPLSTTFLSALSINSSTHTNTPASWSVPLYLPFHPSPYLVE